MLLKDWIEKYYEGNFAVKPGDTFFQTMVEMGWFDWFCDTTELPKRSEPLTEILLQIVNTDLLENYEVSFYNNCPLEGDLYDEIKFEHKSDDSKGGFLKIDTPYKDKKYDFVSYFDLDHCDRTEYNLGKVSTFKTNDLQELIKYLNKLSL